MTLDLVRILIPMWVFLVACNEWNESLSMLLLIIASSFGIDKRIEFWWHCQQFLFCGGGGGNWKRNVMYR